MYTAGLDELAARGFQSRRLSVGEIRAVDDLLGPRPKPIDHDADSRLIEAIRALTDAAEVDFDKLIRRREEILRAAITKQREAVARVTVPWLLVKVWKVRRAISAVNAAAAGLGWFVPRFVVRARQVCEKFVATATLIGVWLGPLCWAAISLSNGRAPTGAWLPLVGTVATLGGVIGLVAAMGKQMTEVAVAWWGQPRGWTLRGMFTAVVATAIFTALLAVLVTGTLLRVSNMFSAWLLAWLDRSGASHAVGAVMMLAIVLYLLRRAISFARDGHVTTTSRVAMGIGAILLAAFAAAVLAFALDVPEPWSAVPLYTFGVALFGGVALLGLIAVVGLVRRYRALPRAG